MFQQSTTWKHIVYLQYRVLPDLLPLRPLEKIKPSFQYCQKQLNRQKVNIILPDSKRIISYTPENYRAKLAECIACRKAGIAVELVPEQQNP